jgi:hypothetical protein
MPIQSRLYPSPYIFLGETDTKRIFKVGKKLKQLVKTIISDPNFCKGNLQRSEIESHWAHED